VVPSRPHGLSPVGKVILEFADFDGGDFDVSFLMSMRPKEVAYLHLLDRMSWFGPRSKRSPAGERPMRVASK
jgi:hypothetical protein